MYPNMIIIMLLLGPAAAPGEMEAERRAGAIYGNNYRSSKRVNACIGLNCRHQRIVRWSGGGDEMALAFPAYMAAEPTRLQCAPPHTHQSYPKSSHCDRGGGIGAWCTASQSASLCPLQTQNRRHLRPKSPIMS